MICGPQDPLLRPKEFADVDRTSIRPAPLRSDLTLITFKSTSSPQAEATTTLVEHLRRDLAPALERGTTNQVYVFGQTAIFIDFAHVLTDKLLFTSGSATIQAAGLPLLGEISRLLNVDQKHPITVEGNTDNQPIQSSQFPSNWELSTDRATVVLRYLAAHGVMEQRLSAAGYADLHPLGSNATAAGRARNRRVVVTIGTP